MDEKQAKRLGTYLRRARAKSGLSQAALAEQVGVRNTSILRLERGEFSNPRPELLEGIADTLGLDRFDLAERAGYINSEDLPSLRVYLRTRYGELPESTSDAITAYAERLARQHGVDLSGPAPGEDEEPEEQPKARATRGGTTSHATTRRTR
jgi:transcriptional regulator with XRE-family HTH domain